MVRPIPRPSGHKLTGKQRYRVHKTRFNKTQYLVLQVEVTWYNYTWDDVPPSMSDKWLFGWRDATVEDVTEGVVV